MENEDIYCKKILMTLLIKGEKVRFNELHRELLKHKVKISRPTLIQHLEHLTARKYVVRREEDKQNVTYEIATDEFIIAKKAKNFVTKEVKKQLKTEKSFKTLTIKDQAYYASLLLYIGELSFVKLNILSIITPDDRLQNDFQSSIIRAMLSAYNKWLMDSCEQSKENALKALEIIDQIGEQIEKSFLEVENNDRKAENQ